MAKAKWSEETIIKQISRLNDLGVDLTHSNVRQVDRKLAGAAVSIFGNWGEAVRAAGIDYNEVLKVSKKKRSDSVRKWSVDRVVEKIREVSATESDISYVYMKEKHPSLVAAACNYIGSWKKALELAGFDYEEVQKRGREAQRERERAWYCEILLERLEKMGTTDSARIRDTQPKFHKLIMQYFKSWTKAVEALQKRHDARDENAGPTAQG